MKAAICDDSALVREQLQKILTEYPKLPIHITAYADGKALLESGETFDILFLDIDMEGLDGIETARRLRQRDRLVKIIYLTNYPDYSMLAISVHAFAYLIKAEEEEKLRRQVYAQLDELFEYLEMELREELEFCTTEGRIFLKVSDILYFEYENRCVKMETLSGSYRLKRKITDVAQEMEKYSFAVPHKSFAVNLYRVKAIKGSDVVLTDGSLLPLSQKKAAVFRRAVNRYMGQLTGKGKGI